ncbi:MAG: hypothetical protein ACTHLY_21870, partial [Pseudolabrys sp.]
LVRNILLSQIERPEHSGKPPAHKPPMRSSIKKVGQDGGHAVPTAESSSFTRQQAAYRRYRTSARPDMIDRCSNRLYGETDTKV